MTALNDKQVEYLIDFLVNDMPFSQRLKMYKKTRKIQGFFAKSNNVDVRNKEFPGVKALEMLSEHYNLESELDFKPRQLAGKCSNGAERDHGLITHAVNHIGALCGAKPGRRSVGWVEPWNDAPVNCEKCLKRIEDLKEVVS